MKIAVPSMGEELESMVSDKLGHCSHIIVYDTKSADYTSFPNPGLLVKDGSGIKTADLIIKAGADVVLSMQVGVKAYSVLTKEHIQVYLLISACSVKDALKNY